MTIHRKGLIQGTAHPALFPMKVVSIHGGGEPVGVIQIEVVGGPDHLELPVEGEKGLQEILLGPEVAILMDPPSLTLPRKQDVVNVNENPRTEPGEDFQILVNDIVADP